MNWYWILYLALIADKINNICVALALILGTAVIVSMIAYFVKDLDKETFKKLKTIRIFFFLSIFLLLFTPKSNQLYIIFGVGSVLEYSIDSEEVKKLPDNAIKALNYYLEDITKEEKQNTQQNE